MPAAALASGMAPMPAVGASGRPQPQTTNQPKGGPFLRHAREASRPGYTVSSAYGAVITQALASAPGYGRYYDLTFQALAGTTTSAAFQADAPYNLIQFVQHKDPWGTPLFTGDGYSLCFLVPLYAGQFYSPLFPGNAIGSLPSFSTVVAGTGAYTFRTMIPLEGTKGYGLISLGNSSVLPTVYLQLNTGAAVLSGTLTSPGAISVTLDEFYYDVDPTMPVIPPGNGSTFQHSVVIGNQPIGSSSSTRVQLPRTGGYLTSLILVLRDSAGVREAETNTNGVGWSSTGRIRVYVDGVPRWDETFLEAQDRMFTFTNGVPRPNGVMAYNFKRSLSQLNLGLLDTLEQAVQTNPGTLIEVEMTPWGTFSSGPAQLQAIVTQLVPAGAPAQGLPEA